MNLGPLVLLYALTKLGRERSPHWPGKRHPPPRRPRAPHHRHAPAHHAHHHAAHHHAAHVEPPPPPPEPPPIEHAEHHVVHHHMPHIVHHAPTHHVVDHAQTAEPQPLSDVHAAAPEPAPASPAPAAAATDVGYPIGQLQRILVGLGWTGHLTMQGPVIRELRDGLYGPVTHDDWQHSAQRRNLNPVFERLGPTTAHVDPDTYATLRQLASSRGAVVGAPGGGFIRIP